MGASILPCRDHSDSSLTQFFFPSELDIAKSLLRSKKSALALDDQAVEEICLTSSREFYDNAGSGNYNFGDMKLAYDWCVQYRFAIL